MRKTLTALVTGASMAVITACVPEPSASPPGAVNTSYLEAEHAPPPGRLSSLARPRHYTLDLTLDPREKGFAGTAQIEIDLHRDSDVIWLHGRKLRVSDSSVLLADGTRVAATYEERLDSGVAAVRFSRVLSAGIITLRIAYEADYDRNLTGLFKVEEQGEAYVLAKSESIQARRYLPGFDEPGMKATYDVRLTIPAGYQAITNSPEMRRETVDPGMERVSFATTRPLPTYLLSLAVGPFDVVQRPPIAASELRPREIPLRGFARKGRAAEMAYILDITPRMLEIFENELLSAYPFAKLDIIAAPQWPSGATELSAAITYREQIILVGEEPAPGARLALLGIHAHELAHMWFGNLVTPPWWDDLWLKEGFATWGTPLALSIMEPEGGHEVTARARAISAMPMDSLASTRAIREPVKDNHNIRNAYDAITYSKSLGLILMVDSYFGAQVFRPALGRYIAVFADGEADSEQFYRVIGEQTATPEITETFRSFVEQKGVPQLTLTAECGGGKVSVTLRQERYRPLGSTIKIGEHHWNIPVCLRSSSGDRHCEIMSRPEQKLALPGGQCPRWILPNAGGDGYYRWNIPAEQWQALLVDFDQFSPTEALSIVDSALAAFEAGSLNPALLWPLIEASAASPQRQVVTAPHGYLERYAKHYFSAEQRVALAENLQLWYQPALDAAAASKDPQQQLLHSQLLSFLALVGGNREAREDLRRRAVQFTGFRTEREDSALSSDLYESALTVAVQDLGAEFIAHLRTVRRQLDNPRFDSASANAFGRTTAPDLLPQIHALALSDELGPRESFDLLRRATATPETREANWRWINDNFEQIIAKIPAQWRRRSPLLAADFCSEQSLLQLQRLFARHADLAPGYERALAQTKERLQLCMAMANRGKALAESL